MNNSNQDNTSNIQENAQPSESSITGLEKKNFRERVLYDAYTGVSRVFNAPIDFWCGVCKLPEAFAGYLKNSKHDRNH